MRPTFYSLVIALGLSVLGAFAAESPWSSNQAPDVTPPTRRNPLPEPANPKLPTLFLIGDSTVRNGRDDGQGKGPAGQWGWGHLIAEYFDPAKINVVNRAVGGLSSRTYLTGGFWERTLPLVKAGDVVIMQFGHNDSSAINDKARARGTIKGVGDETKEIDNLRTNKHEIVHSYGWYLRKFVADTRAKGATPIICSLIPRKLWDDQGHIRRNKGDYAGWAEQVAEQEHVPFIDLNGLVAQQYDALGHEAVMKLFPQVTPDEHTHTNWAGADLNARTVVAALKTLHPDPLASYFSAKGESVPPAEPAKQRGLSADVDSRYRLP